eukprot:1491205-Rhodomonas_salina.1
MSQAETLAHESPAPDHAQRFRRRAKHVCSGQRKGSRDGQVSVPNAQCGCAQPCRPPSQHK